MNPTKKRLAALPPIAASSHLPPVRPLLRRWSHWAVLPPPCLGLCSASFLPCFSLGSQSSHPDLAQSHVTPLSKRMTLLPPDLSATLTHGHTFGGCHHPKFLRIQGRNLLSVLTLISSREHPPDPPAWPVNPFPILPPPSQRSPYH